MKILEKNNVMLDIETMGNNSNSAIVAIGAVKFGEEVTGKFYSTVSLESSLEAGLQIDADTVMWLMQQGVEARSALSKDTVPLLYALDKFNAWICNTVGREGVVWGNGATFDNVILSNAYRALGLKRPWHYTADMCYRTLKNLHPEIKLVRQGTFHKADDDAESQANHLIKILKEKYG